MQSQNDQIDRFKKAARDAKADEADDVLDRIMDKLNLTRKPSAKEPENKGTEDGS